MKVMTESLTLQQQRSQETRKRILDAAFRVFAGQGIGEATVDDIAHAAGISKGALYHHFASKEQLFQSLLKDRVKDCQEHMLSTVGEITSLPRAIRDAIQASFTSHHADPDWTPMFMEIWVQATRDDFARSIVAEAFRSCRGTVAQILRSGQGLGFVRPEVDVDAVALLYLAMVDGIRIQAQIDAQIDVSRAKESMADMLVGFIQSKER